MIASEVRPFESATTKSKLKSSSDRMNYPVLICAFVCLLRGANMVGCDYIEGRYNGERIAPPHIELLWGSRAHLLRVADVRQSGVSMFF